MKQHMLLEREKLDTLISILQKEKDVIALYVFGSQAKGRTRPDSDFDMAIAVRERTTKDELYFLGKFKHLPIPLPQNIHLTVVDLQSSSPLLLQRIVKTGVVLYQKSAQDITVFQAQVALRYFDTAHMRNIQNSYLGKRFREGTYGY